MLKVKSCIFENKLLLQLTITFYPFLPFASFLLQVLRIQRNLVVQNFVENEHFSKEFFC